MATQSNTYRKLMLLMMRSKQHMAVIMEQHQMTPIQGILLVLFEPAEGRTMQELSSMMACDASNTTGLIDRLDTHGLIERTVDPNDRRVKVISLSDKGFALRAKVLEAISKNEAADMQRLTNIEQEQLAKLLSKLLKD
ncbi:MAG: MarR family transcriptional regulator [Patescibacteria group bacterium]|nr:MarR family transcriptional regulator [Patescibacteria group bacterium]